jgi:hypothetical protein
MYEHCAETTSISLLPIRQEREKSPRSAINLLIVAPLKMFDQEVSASNPDQFREHALAAPLFSISWGLFVRNGERFTAISRALR